VTEAERKILSDLVELTLWMTGSADFGPEGQAHAGWLKGKPALDRALLLLAAADVNFPAESMRKEWKDRDMSAGYPDECPHCKAKLERPDGYSRVIGVSDGDRITHWCCPDCKITWARTESAPSGFRRCDIVFA
jgi:hypothetical protein